MPYYIADFAGMLVPIILIVIVVIILEIGRAHV